MTPVEAPSPEVLAERVKMALAEAGWPEARVMFRQGAVEIDRWGVPAAVAWAAFAAADIVACWSCWLAGDEDPARSESCAAGDCQAGPDEPRRPPRELLLRREP